MSNQIPDPYSQYQPYQEPQNSPYPADQATSASPYPPSEPVPAVPYQQPQYQEASYTNAPYGTPAQGLYMPQSPYGYPQQPMPQNDQGSGQALAGLVLGIISMIAWLFPLAGVPLAILGIIFSALGRRSFSRKTMATVGLVLSIIALVLALGNAALGAYLVYQQLSGY